MANTAFLDIGQGQERASGERNTFCTAEASVDSHHAVVLLLIFCSPALLFSGALAVSRDALALTVHVLLFHNVILSLGNPSCRYHSSRTPTTLLNWIVVASLPSLLVKNKPGG